MCCARYTPVLGNATADACFAFGLLDAKPKTREQSPSHHKTFSQLVVRPSKSYSVLNDERPAVLGIVISKKLQ